MIFFVFIYQEWGHWVFVRPGGVELAYRIQTTLHIREQQIRTTSHMGDREILAVRRPWEIYLMNYNKHIFQIPIGNSYCLFGFQQQAIKLLFEIFIVKGGVLKNLL